MTKQDFKIKFREVNGFYLQPDWIFFRRPLELWNELTGETRRFKNLDEALASELNGRTVAEILAGQNHLEIPPLDGRGQSGGSGNRTFKFGESPKKGKDESRPLLPAMANVKLRVKSFAGMLEQFRQEHIASDREWAYEVDDQGYVHQYVRGNPTSVRIGGSIRDGVIIHNHPTRGEPAFSSADLISTALGREKGIIASSPGWDYFFQKKGGHFRPAAFVKAIRGARMTGKNYNDAVDKWLTDNQKKYGYSYRRTRRGSAQPA